MPFKLKYILVVPALLFGLFASSDSLAAPADCRLTNAVWNPMDQAAVGQTVQLVTMGNQDCWGLDVVFNIYAKGVVSDTYLRSVRGTYNPNTVSSFVNYVFTAQDYKNGGDKSGSEKIYFFAEPLGPNNTSLGTLARSPRSGDLTLLQPTGGCQINSAKWYITFSAQPILGSPLHMAVSGINCAGYSASFKIYTADTFTEEVDTVNATFNSSGNIDVIWKANNKIDTRPLSSRLGNYNFYFIVSADKSKMTSNQIKIPANSETGCINCNAGLAPNPVLCADGTSHTRGLGEDSQQICKSHIGDALTDKPPGGGGGGGGGGDTGPIASRSYFFEIKNPLRGGPNDLFDIINIATQWLLNIAIPLAVLFILYAGFLMLTAGDKPAKFDKGKKVLTNVVLGLAIIFIGRGFITLIYSVLELGGTGGGTVTGQCVGDDYMVNGKIAGGCTNGVVNNAQVCVNGKWWQAGKDLNQTCSDKCKNRVCQNGKGTCEKDADCKSAQKKIGEVCQRDGDCNSGLKCKNTMCQFPLGNEAGQACLTGQNCATGLSCDNTSGASKVVDGRTVGTCVRPN